jgi:dolichol-phosphate mannosyltransferase
MAPGFLSSSYTPPVVSIRETDMIRLLLKIIILAQALLAIRVFARMVATSRGQKITTRPPASPPEAAGNVSVLVPVLNEEQRLGPCLAGLSAQNAAVGEIIVVDGGSTDATGAVVQAAAAHDPRIRLISAAPVPAGVNAKAYGLAVAAREVSETARSILVIDADVRPAPGLAAAMRETAETADVKVLSAATRQQLSGPAEGVVHPALLTTLVYRFGIPGQVAEKPEDVQANGQVLLIDRDVLAEVGGFDAVQQANAEDVTLVRRLVARGHPAGFFEAGDLVTVEMYPSWRAAWDGWTRSLPMRDEFSTWRLPVGLAEILLVQAAPLPLWALFAWRCGLRHPLTALQGGLLMARFGVLAGTRRAYVNPPVTYWLSPLVDLPVSLKLIVMARRRRFTWRGRDFVTGDPH